MLSDYPNLIDHFVFTYRQQKTIQFQRLFETLDLDLFEAGAERLMAEMRSRLPTIGHLKLSQSLQAIRQVLKQKNPDRKAFRRLTKNAKKIVQNLDNQRIVQDLLQTADVVFCTLSTAGSNPVQRTGEFSDLIIDEASACTEPEVLISLCKRPKRMLLVGDPSQLPVMVHSLEAAKQGLTVSLQERLMFQNGNPYTMLDKQYRMSPAISKWPTAQFYQGKLVDAPAITVHDNTPDHPLLLNEYPYTWVNIPGEELKDENHSTFNEAELGAIVSVILDWQKSNSIPDTWLSSPDHIRVVTFYKAQADYLSMEFKRLNIGVTVSTVDATQGCEADIVVLSFVRGTTGHMGFIKNLRRLNVALTRARRQLVCVGNLSAILELKEEGANLVLRDMAEDAFERADVIEWSVESRFFIQNE
jgi:superfamily I DNA and/or RNA helicase